MKKMTLRITNRVFCLRSCITYRIAIHDEQDRYMHEDTNNIRKELDIEEILLFYFNGMPRVCIVLGINNIITQIHLSDSRTPRSEKLGAFFSGLIEQARIFASGHRNDFESTNIYTMQNIMYVVNTKVNKMLNDASLINNAEINLIWAEK